jgi:hypothetical protein
MKCLVVLLALVVVAFGKINPNPLGRIDVTLPNDDYSFGAVITAREGIVVAALDYNGFSSPMPNATLFAFDVRGDSPKLLNSISLPNPGPTQLFSYQGGAGIYAVVQNLIPQRPVLVDVVVTPNGQIVAGRSTVTSDELTDKVVIFGQTNRFSDHVYLVDRNIWTLDRTAWKLNKGPALEFPTNANLFAGDVNYNDRTIAVSGYQMCLAGEKGCDPNMGTWYLFRFNATNGKVITSTRIAGTEWALLNNVDSGSNAGLRIQDVNGKSLNLIPFDYGTFKSSNALADSTSRPFTFNQRLTSTRSAGCTLFAWADSKNLDIDQVRITQLAVGGDGTLRVVDQQSLAIQTTFTNLFAPQIVSTGSRLYLAAKNTLYIYEASC